MPSITALNVGQTERVHVKLWGPDPANAQSQVVDLTSNLTVTATNPTLGTAVMDPNDNRAVLVTAVAPGQPFFRLDRAGAPLPASVLFTVPVNAPFVDNSRLEILSADAPF